MTIETRLAKIRARAEAATEGPWMVNGPGEEWAAISSGPHAVIHAYTVHDGDCPGCECGDGAAEVALTIEDAEFIAASRTDLPTLLAAVEAVIVLHRLTSVSEDYYDQSVMRDVCAECDQYWPCNTLNAITDALDAQDTTTREDPS